MITNLSNRIAWGLATLTTERIDKIFVCKTCKALFLFKGDVEDHMQAMPKHQDFVSVPFK
jgi:hypothetical protein